MSKLLFHRVGSAEISPFDEAIVSIAKESHIKLVSPYIGIRYLQRLIALSLGWRLISDIEAWLSSLSKDERILSTQFIQENCDRIHHFPAIHAKTVIGCATAYLGSANLTLAGIQTRTEMGVLVDEPAMIADLHSWFDELWSATSMPVMDEVLAYSHGLESESRNQNLKVALKPLSFDGEQVRARLMRLPDAPSITVRPDVLKKFEHIEPKFFRDLEDEIRLLIERLANSGFTFKEFLAHVRKSGVIFRTRAAYVELSRYCGNLPRSVFSPDTVNRLIYKNGFFSQSVASAVETSLAQYDTFLATLVSSLSFADAEEVPRQLDTGSSIRNVWVRRWMHDLKQSGFLIEHIAKTKNSLISYQLNEKFEWASRWRMFEQARQAWDEKLKSYRGLVSPSTAMTSNDGCSKIKIDIEISSDKSVSPVSALTSSPNLGQSVYVRTQMEKRLPPIMAMTVSPSSKKTTFEQEKLSISHRADNVYLSLFKRLHKSEVLGITKKDYFQLIDYLAKYSGESADFVFQVLEGKISYLPVAAKIIIFKRRRSVSALLNAVPVYPKTNAFLKTTLGKEKNKFIKLSTDQDKPKIDQPERPTLAFKSNLNTAPKNGLRVHNMPEEKNKICLQVKRLDEVSEYMQRVASIFKNPSN